MAMMRTISNGYHGLYLLIGTSRFFLLADFLFIYDLVIDPLFHKKKFKRPPIALWFVVVPLAISLIWSANPNDGFQTVVRIIVLAFVIPTYKFRGAYHRVVLVSLVLLYGLVSFQIFGTERPNGIHMNASSLGQSGFAFMAIKFWPVGLVSGFILAFSLARAPLLVFGLFALFTRNRQILLIAFTTMLLWAVVASIQRPDRISFSGTEKGIETRIDTFKSSEPVNDMCGVKRELEYRIFGYGFQSFCLSTGQVRPHNIYVLSVYELGLLAIPFWFGVIMLARKFPFRTVLPLFLLGLVTEELFGRPEGVYLITIWLVSTSWMQTERTPEAPATHLCD